MNHKTVNVGNLPKSFREQVRDIQNADEVFQLSRFVDTGAMGEKSGLVVSNTFQNYDLWSRFVREKRRPSLLSEADKAVTKRKVSDKIQGKEYQGRIEITPAIISKKDIDYIAYPSDREEKVERALIRLASKGNIIAINGKMGERYAVAFSLKELQNEMKSVNQTLNLPDLKESLQILKLASLRIVLDVIDPKTGEVEHFDTTTNYLDAVHFSGERGRTSVKCIAVLNSIVASKIENVEYRGYLFERTQSFSRSLSRWLAVRLYTMFRYAATGKSYHFMLVDQMVRFGSIESKKIENGRLVAIRRDMTQTMRDFIEADIIAGYDVENRKDENDVIIDYKYTIYPSQRFTEEVIGLNKQAKAIELKSVNEEEMKDLIK
ncbi:replication protein A [Pseudoalteromonas sp. MMG013]|uniref:replication protein A n=1 Tax=Pseudoalteromonas sp. MMG013 TaxID=2822687 RepID=UPI001B35C0E6|nr:replication protein A [Pseudoalteromonas sp. MMG013]MBQ4862177.1 replication protein A [Pseudoalteromonas sp. MMG013]